MELVVYDTAEKAYIGAARRITELLERATDGFNLGLAGGNAAQSLYDTLRGNGTGWDRVDAWMSDERWVPLDHERSNGRLAVETLFGDLPVRLHRPPWGESMDPADSAARYEETLRSIFDGRRPDLILLGMGDDGHTASLFPGSEALTVDDRWYVSNVIPESGEPRLTSTYPLLWNAALLMVVTTGEEKASALRDTFEDKSTPASRIGEGDAEVEWHVDRAAASLLS